MWVILRRGDLDRRVYLQNGLLGDELYLHAVHLRPIADAPHTVVGEEVTGKVVDVTRWRRTGEEKQGMPVYEGVDETLLAPL